MIKHLIIRSLFFQKYKFISMLLVVIFLSGLCSPLYAGNETIIRLVFKKLETGTTQTDSTGKKEPFFYYDPRKDLPIRLNKMGFKVVPEDSTNFDATIYVEYREYVVGKPPGCCKFSFVLEDNRGVKLIDYGYPGHNYVLGVKFVEETLDVKYLPEIVKSALEGKEKVFIYIPYLDDSSGGCWKNTSVRWRALEILRKIKDPRAIEYIVPILKDRCDFNRREAKLALIELGYKPQSEEEQ